MGRFKIVVGMGALGVVAMLGQLVTGGVAHAAPVVPTRPGPAPQAVAAEPVCGPSPLGEARCNSRVVVGPDGVTPQTSSTPAGYGPNDLRAAYGLNGATGSGTVAIVDAYDDPNALNDVNVYRAQFGIQRLNNGGPTFTKVSQSGSPSPLPKANGGWAQEISLDLDMVSAICPGCNILLVEASSASFSNLGAAVNAAAAFANVKSISNSYGGSEFSSEGTYDASYKQSGIAVTASSGDSGYGVEYPAASPYVTAVGGTSLSRASNTRGWNETAWSGAGSGCSAFESKQTGWQTDSLCSKRMVADVSAVADPNTGVAVYDSYAYRGASGWMVFGGTSVASPIIASVYALAGGITGTTYGSYPYGHDTSSTINDVVSGSNGSCGTYLCDAAFGTTTGASGVDSGYDGPTGLGTPNGIGGF